MRLSNRFDRPIPLVGRKGGQETPTTSCSEGPPLPPAGLHSWERRTHIDLNREKPGDSAPAHEFGERNASDPLIGLLDAGDVRP